MSLLNINTTRPRNNLFMTLAIVALASLAVIEAWQIWAPKKSNAPSIQYLTASGQSTSEGLADTPLTLIVRFPNSQPQDQPIALDLQLLDTLGEPAAFGSNTPPILSMRPTLDVGLWEYKGSIPTLPGDYHARLQVQMPSAASQTSSPFSIDLREPVLHVKADGNPPLKGGYVFKGDRDLWLLSEDTSREKRLTFFAETGQTVTDPSWSPEGNTIAFAYLPNRNAGELPRTEIWAINPDGTNLRKLATPSPDETLLEPAWSTDGNALFFGVDRLSNSPIPPGSGKSVLDQYRRIDRLDLRTGTRLQAQLGAQTPAIGPRGDMAYLEDAPPANPGDTPGQQLVYRTKNAPHTVLVPPMTYIRMRAPAISPDREWVVFSAPNGGPARPQERSLLQFLAIEPDTAYAHDIPWDLFMISTAGGKPIRLTTLDEDEPFPVWLNPSTIAFAGKTGLYKLNIDPTGNPITQPTKLHTGLDHTQLSWHTP